MFTPAIAIKPTRNEGLKEGSPLLTGTIAQTLADASADRFSDDDYEFLKFHGVYQQDDRDKRKTGKHYMLMVRTKFPGGVLTALQYLACDRLASEYGNDTLRVTTRQDFQFHGVLKGNLRATIKALNEVLITTIAACGDVNRNVMAPPTPATSPVVDTVLALAAKLSLELTPQTTAYHQIWLEGKEVEVQSPANAGFVDPLYGKTYLPRKFKVGFAIPPRNDVDVFTNDVGYIAAVENGVVTGYTLLAGGGLGMSHGNALTFPRLADVIGFVTPDQVVAATKAVLTIHRDFGDRTNRKHARLKYILAERGVEWFRAEVEKRAQLKLGPAPAIQFEEQGDWLGWHAQNDGNYFLGLFVQSGRIQDREGYRLKTGLRRVVEQFQPEVRLTPSQNVLLVNVRPEQRAPIEQLLSEHGVSAQNPYSRTRRAAMACPALPTCGLALAESERALPDILNGFETLLSDLGIPDEELIVRMTGCPNGCARPYTAEVALVGKAPNKYQIYLGGNVASTRLNRLYKDSVKGEELMGEFRALLSRYLQQRTAGERFGDFCARAIWPETSGATPG